MEPRPRHRWRPWAGIVLIALLIVGAIVYTVTGRHRAEDACALDTAVPVGADGSTWTTSWSWSPLGFACTWPSQDGGDDITVSKLWW